MRGSRGIHGVFLGWYGGGGVVAGGGGVTDEYEEEADYFYGYN